VLLAFGALAALPAQAQTTPAVPNLTVTPTPGTDDKLDVSWGAVTNAEAYRVRWKTGGQMYDNDTRRLQFNVTPGTHPTSGQITGLNADTAYDVEVTVFTSTPVLSVLARSEVRGTRTNPPSLTVSVAPVASTSDSLRVSWNSVTGADKYLVKWRAGRDSFNAGREVTGTSTTLTGLYSGGNYQVEVSAIDTDPNPDRVLVRDKARGKPHQAAIPSMTVTPVTNRSDQLDVSWNAPAEAALNRFYLRWKESGAAYDSWYVSSLTGGRRDEPRQPAAYLTDRTKFRIGGLKGGTRYDVEVVARRSSNVYLGFGARAEVTGTQTNAVPTLHSGLGSGIVTEGQRTYFEVHLFGNAVAPEGGLTVNVLIADATGGSDFLDAADEGLKTVTIPEGEGSVNYYLSTVDDDEDEPNGSVRGTIQSGTGYQLIANAALRTFRMDIRDNDLPKVPNLRAVGVDGDATKLAVSWGTYTGAAKYKVQWRTLTGTYGSGQERTTTSYTISSLTAGTTYMVRVQALDSSNAVIAQSEVRGTANGTPLLAGLQNLRASPIEGRSDALGAEWDEWPGADNYRVYWKTGSGNYGSRYRLALYNGIGIPDLAPNTEYTIKVVATRTYLFQSSSGIRVVTTELAWAEVTATTSPSASLSEAPQRPEPDRTPIGQSFTVYHDPDSGAAAVARYDTGVGLLREARQAFTVHDVTGTDKVDRLAGVEDSVLPRFFLGNPAAEDWTSEPGVNNGGLKWLRSVLAEAQASSSPTPALSIAAGPAVTEGTDAAFTVTLSAAAPEGGLTLAYRVSEDGDFVAASDEGAKTAAIPAGATSAAISVPTGGDDGDEPDGSVTVTLETGTGYTFGSPSSASVTVRDDDDAPVAGPSASAIMVYHDPSHSAVVSRYHTAVGLLTAAGRSYTVRNVTGTGDVDRLAGVSNSVLPRFFLGDPAETGWTSQPGTNNGGLRWLRSVLGQASSAPAVPAVSVADASAQESSGSMEFTVTLSAASGDSVSVDYATSDGTATAGSDYTAASGALTFAPGETSKKVTVTLLDDMHDEGTETFTLTLSNLRPAGKATLANATATGSISNADPLQKDWLARFGRAAASDAVAAITARFETPRDAGSHFTVGGHRLSFDGSGAEAGVPPAPVHGPVGASWPSWSDDPAGGGERTMSGRELLLGTSFRAVLGSGAGVQWTGWGQGASVSQFSSTSPGLSLSGETATGTMGMDYERGPLLAGFAMTHSLGEGTAHGAGRTYAMGSAVTTMLPYARFALSERVSAWGLAGTGTGRLTLDLDGGASQRYGTDLSMALAAAGLRGDLLTPADAGGFALALKADALWVRTESEAVSAPGVGRLAGARADASRLRAVLDGSRRFALAGGRALTPSVELGLRHDGGDAETGTGFELGAGLGYADPSRGLDMALRVHGLAAHAEEGYSEWSVSGSLRLEPGGSGRGLSMSLIPTWGNAANDAERLWSARDAGELGLAEDFEAQARLEGELGYGLSVGGMPGVVTPFAGFTAAGGESRSYRTGARWRIAPDATLTLEAARSEGAGGEPPEHRIGLEAGFRW